MLYLDSIDFGEKCCSKEEASRVERGTQSTGMGDRVEPLSTPDLCWIYLRCCCPRLPWSDWSASFTVSFFHSENSVYSQSVNLSMRPSHQRICIWERGFG